MVVVRSKDGYWAGKGNGKARGIHSGCATFIETEWCAASFVVRAIVMGAAVGSRAVLCVIVGTEVLAAGNDSKPADVECDDYGERFHGAKIANRVPWKKSDHQRPYDGELSMGAEMIFSRMGKNVFLTYMEIEPRHQCFIYEGAPSKKLMVIGGIIQRKLADGYRCLYLNSSPMVSGLRSTLSAMGVNVASEVAKARLVMSSEPVTKNGEFDVTAMIDQLEASLDQALADGYKGLWASGDMTWEFGIKRDFSKLMQYEMKLEELMAKRPALCGICQYHTDSLPHDVVRQALLAHSGVVINETLSRVNPHYLKPSWPIDQTLSDQMDEMIAALCKA